MMMPALHVSKRSGLCCAHSTGESARASALLDRLGLDPLARPKAEPYLGASMDFLV